MSAAFGQGVNSALEDCTVLGEVLASAPSDIDAALQRYERRRRPNAHALGTMDHQVSGMCVAFQRSACVCVVMLVPAAAWASSRFPGVCSDCLRSHKILL